MEDLRDAKVHDLIRSLAVPFFPLHFLSLLLVLFHIAYLARRHASAFHKGNITVAFSLGGPNTAQLVEVRAWFPDVGVSDVAVRPVERVQDCRIWTIAWRPSVTSLAEDLPDAEGPPPVLQEPGSPLSGVSVLLGQQVAQLAGRTAAGRHEGLVGRALPPEGPQRAHFVAVAAPPPDAVVPGVGPDGTIHVLERLLEKGEDGWTGMVPPLLAHNLAHPDEDLLFLLLVVIPPFLLFLLLLLMVAELAGRAALCPHEVHVSVALPPHCPNAALGIEVAAPPPGAGAASSLHVPQGSLEEGMDGGVGGGLIAPRGSSVPERLRDAEGGSRPEFEFLLLLLLLLLLQLHLRVAVVVVVVIVVVVVVSVVVGSVLLGLPPSQGVACPGRG